MSEVFAYCIRVRGMNKTGRALKCEGISTIPMTFTTREASIKYMKDNGIEDVCYAGVLMYEEDYYVKTWSLAKIQSIKVKGASK